MKRDFVIILICLFCMIIMIVGANGQAIYDWFSNWFNTLGNVGNALQKLSQSISLVVQKVINFFNK